MTDWQPIETAPRDGDEMTLDTALLILAESHTRDNDFSGFTVESGRDSCGRWNKYDYIEAWKTVRQHLHLKTEPTPED